jgi:hypothetical protein
VVVPSQEHGYPYVSDVVVVHPFDGRGLKMTVSWGDRSSGEAMFKASRPRRIGFMGASVGDEGVPWLNGDPPAVVDAARGNGWLLSGPHAARPWAPGGTIGVEETGARTVERRSKVNSSMAGVRHR